MPRKTALNIEIKPDSYDSEKKTTTTKDRQKYSFKKSGCFIIKEFEQNCDN